MKKLLQTWRWFGEEDPISLLDIRQTGASGIVTALHHVPNGEIWSMDEILKRKQHIELSNSSVTKKSNLYWSVVESIPVHEDIKKQTGYWIQYINNYKESIRNLGNCGIPILTYNFMPVVDWTRTDLSYRMPDKSLALRLDKTALAAFDIFILKRKNIEGSYSNPQIIKAEKYFTNLTQKQKEQLSNNIIAGLPGSEEKYSTDDFRDSLAEYQDIDHQQLQSNLIHFIKEIAPVAEEAGIKLAIHPDDPPFSILGLPRVVSTMNDIQTILDCHNSTANGLCFCSGSLGARRDNDVIEMAQRFSARINFLHLRNISLEEDGSFYEADHLSGNTNMSELMNILVQEQQKRDKSIPMRPDHGHQMTDDLNRKCNPGYSMIGRMKGLAELRGLEMGILNNLNDKE